MRLSVEQLRALKRDPKVVEKALIKIAIAFETGAGVRLSWDDLRDLYCMDDALHQRLCNEYDEHRWRKEETRKPA